MLLTTVCNLSIYGLSANGLNFKSAVTAQCSKSNYTRSLWCNNHISMIEYDHLRMLELFGSRVLNLLKFSQMVKKYILTRIMMTKHTRSSNSFSEISAVIKLVFWEISLVWTVCEPFLNNIPISNVLVVFNYDISIWCLNNRLWSNILVTHCITWPTYQK